MLLIDPFREVIIYLILQQFAVGSNVVDPLPMTPITLKKNH